jgi:putative permease
MKLITEWFQRVFADRQAMILVIILALGTAVILLLGKMLAPVIAGAIIAYLLEGVVRWLERRGVPRIIGVSVVFLAFCAFVLVMLFGLAPLIYRQLNQLVQLFPTIITKGQDALMQLPQSYPRLIDERYRSRRAHPAVRQCRQGRARGLPNFGTLARSVDRRVRRCQRRDA